MKVHQLNLFDHVFENHEEDQLQLNDDMEYFHQEWCLYHEFYSIHLINYEASLELYFHHKLKLNQWQETNHVEVDIFIEKDCECKTFKKLILLSNSLCC